jgi:tRNA(fMet)-specific endonuclease VapC
MNGNRYLLDTNAIVALLQGNSQLIQLLQNADWIGISVISQIEFLAFSGLSQGDRQPG